MEEVEEGDPAPPVPLPLHRRGHGFRGGAGKVKSPLATTRIPSLSASASLSGSASMKARNVLPSKIEMEGLKGFGSNKTPQQPQEEKNSADGKASSSWGAAVDGPDDGGEKAIKDVLALLSTGGVDALTGGINNNDDNNTGAFATSHAAAVKTLETTKKSWEEIEEVEEAAEVGGAKMTAGDTGATGAAKKVDEEVEEEVDEDDEEEEEEEEDGGYRRMGGLYNREEDYDDDDDPYGEEA